MGNKSTPDQLARTLQLLRNKELSIKQIAARMQRTLACIVAINRKHGIRIYARDKSFQVNA